MKFMSKLLDQYQIYLYSQKIKVPALYWIFAFIIISLIFSLLVGLLSIKFGILVFAVILDLGIGIPIFLYDKHINTIEKYWPSALRLIADTMKSGSSFDYALREASSADFGPLSFEFNEVLRRLEMGDTTQDALSHLSLRVDSRIVRRTITLIKECLRTGAQLSEVLNEIANDTKYQFRIKRERITKTMLQVIFIFAAGAVIAPFIFGLTSIITKFLISVAVSSGIATGDAIIAAESSQNAISVLLDIYVALEVFAASAIVSLMRDGKVTNMFIFFPAMISIAYVIYSISQLILTSLLGGMV